MSEHVCPFCNSPSVPILVSGEPIRYLCIGPEQHQWQYDLTPVEESPAETLPVELL